jgi:hypothetical protein
MTARFVFFTQPGCLSCEFMKFFLEAKEIIFESAISVPTPMLANN